ncbi:MAG: aminotransferase class I/II-fold pyridoxal phosphate-dependent enzyme, partial [Acidimicrobiia bacterium]|nr:aminotransferase class I/II-fold pyridoxal phosphate-dependent enzyme [Acidimicrobiia bacterium]
MGEDIFAKCSNPRKDLYLDAVAAGFGPFFKEMASESGPTVIHAGRRVIMLGSNNYLGLTSDERVKRAAVEAVERFGSGVTGSRLMNGTLPLHRELEETLLDWLGGDDCLVFTTGYAVNLGVLSTLVGPEDQVFLDSSCHASLADGAKMASGTTAFFRHNSVDSLLKRVRTWRRQSEGGALVAVDTVYSMEGDMAPLRQIADVCDEYGARLLVDEAHALGLLGPKGAGLAAETSIQPDLVMGTFSKSLASCGGFLIGPRSVLDWLRIACRPFLFTASGVPAALGAALAAVNIAVEEEWRREAVQARAGQLRAGLRDLGFEAGGEPGSPIVPVHIVDDIQAALLWRALLDNGVYVNCAA